MSAFPTASVGVKLAEKPVALEGAGRLFQDLNSQEIRYCAWKSSVRLEQGLRGETDLDLLVDRRESARFAEILAAHGIKQVHAASGKNYPAIENYLGLDTISGSLFHLHVHYQLVLGQQFVKNYRLPLEAWLLDDVRLRQGVKIPAPERELAVLAVRAMLKYRFRDAIKDIFGIKSPGIPPAIAMEIRFLLEQTCWTRIVETLEEAAQVVPSAIVLSFLKTMIDSPRQGAHLWRLRGQLCREMNSYQLRSRLAAAVGYTRGQVRKAKILPGSRARKMTLPRGGIVLALFGADGAGKTTLATTLDRWLGWKIDVRSYYMGSKQPSSRSELLYMVYRGFRRFHRSFASLVSDKSFASSVARTLRDAALCMHYVSIAYDRRRRELAVRKDASRGSVVICDRFPLASSGQGQHSSLLDGPKGATIPPGALTSILRPLVAWERSIYSEMHPPDYLFLLNVSSQVAFRRKPDHNSGMILSKIRAAKRLALATDSRITSTQVIRLNADRPFDKVLTDLKSAVWQIL